MKPLLIPTRADQLSALHTVADGQGFRVTEAQELSVWCMRPNPRGKEDVNQQAFHVARGNIDKQVIGWDFSFAQFLQILADCADVPAVCIDCAGFDIRPCVLDERIKIPSQSLRVQFCQRNHFGFAFANNAMSTLISSSVSLDRSGFSSFCISTLSGTLPKARFISASQN